MNTKTAPTNLEITIDAIGALNEQIKPLEAKLKELKKSLGDLADGTYKGIKYQVNISNSKRGNLDMEAVREKLSPQFIAAHTTYTNVFTVRPGIRKDD